MLNPWGVNGQVKALPLSKFSSALTENKDVILIMSKDRQIVRQIQSIKPLNRFFIISFYGIHDRQEALNLRGATISVAKESLILSDGEYFHDQIIGLGVFTTEGEHVGRVEGIFETGSSDIYVVRHSCKEYLIPAIKDVIQEIDIQGQRIIIKKMSGLLD
ncbi:MAG: 16S rRNA processing protein RimM [Nitrospirae bacterium]|nr:16S rRNA processing protein RimM [Nitrospirota bacterium]